MKFYFENIQEVKRKHTGHFFDRGAMRFFNSKILPSVYRGSYFITSEQYNYEAPRLYSIRMILQSGKIETIGNFQQFESKKTR